MENSNSPKRINNLEDQISREYRLFREAGIRKPTTLYEKVCDFAERILHVNPDSNTKKKMDEAIEFAHLNLTPAGVASLTVLFTIIICVTGLVFLMTRFMLARTVVVTSEVTKLCIPGTSANGMCVIPGFGLDLGLFLILIAVAMPIAYYIYIYPMHLKKKYEMDAGGDIVSAILYIVCYMRNTPSLEGAVDFAARNITGSLAEDLRKLMWDVRVGNYLSINEALLDYAEKWKGNREFVESIELLIASLRSTGSRRISLLDEAVRVILEGNRESARHYVQNLRMPLMVIHAMGIILPVMGLVMFPIIAIFLAVDPIMLIIGYDIILPLVLFFVIEKALEKRPATFSKIDISEHPDVPPDGKFFVGKRAISPLPIAVFVSVVVIGFGFILNYLDNVNAKTSAAAQAVAVMQAQGVVPAIIIIFGIALGPAIYYLALSRRRAKVREDVQKIEGEFKESLFQLGNTIGGGVPIETALSDSIKRMEGLKIKDMYIKAANNMRGFGMTFSDAFFNKEYGSIVFYPSRLVKSVMRAVVESAKKGVKTAATSMLSVSKYLRDIHRTQEQVKESLNEVVSSLRFQAYILSPLIAGVISTMAIIMIIILQSLALKAPTMGAGMPSSFMGIAPGNMSISPFEFILVVGVYLVESLILLCYLMSGIDSGDDPIGRQELTGYILIIGVITFTITVFVSLNMFQPLATAVT